MTVTRRSRSSYKIKIHIRHLEDFVSCCTAGVALYRIHDRGWFDSGKKDTDGDDDDDDDDGDDDNIAMMMMATARAIEQRWMTTTI